MTPHFAGVIRRMTRSLFLSCALVSVLVAGCDASTQVDSGGRQRASTERPTLAPALAINRDWRSGRIPFGLRLSAAAEERARQQVTYDAAYVRIPYPTGDVAPDRGVCSDEVVRAYRLMGVDLQRLVHEDMRRAFHAYPKRWGLSRPDPNIDHRRVPNLATFFSRHGTSLPVSSRGRDYQAGDVVTFALADGRPHIGIVTERMSADGERPLVMHNIGLGPQIEDMLFSLTITGRYRYEGPRGGTD
jgi:uncharacterized protein YijF (DUF1287 family)